MKNKQSTTNYFLSHVFTSFLWLTGVAFEGYLILYYMSSPPFYGVISLYLCLVLRTFVRPNKNK